MHVSKKFVLFFLLLFSLFFLKISFVFADDVSVSASVGDTSITLSGYTSPNSLVTFVEQNSVSGTTLSNSGGFFLKQFSSQTEGIHTVSIFSSDINGNHSITVNLNYVLVLGQNVSISDIFLPPTIKFSNSSTEFYKGDVISVSGWTVPGRMLRAEISGETGKVEYLTSGDDGSYSYSFSSDDLSLGNYFVKIKLEAASSVSTTSEEKSFSLRERAGVFSTSPSLTSTPNIVKQGELLIKKIFQPETKKTDCRYPFVNICFFDKDKKGFLFLEKDLVNYLKNFRDLFGKPTMTYFDINQDGEVDAKDLSIVLSYAKTYFDVSRTSSVAVVSSDDNVLGVQEAREQIEAVLRENGIFVAIINLLSLEFAIGIPALFLSILLISIWRKYGERK